MRCAIVLSYRMVRFWGTLMTDDGNTASGRKHTVWSYILGSVAFLIQAPFSVQLMLDAGKSSTFPTMRLWSVLFFLPSWVIAIFGIGQGIKAIRELSPTGKTLRWAVNALYLNALSFLFVVIAIVKVYSGR